MSSGSDERTERLALAYRAFNDRDIDALLAMLTDEVEWPDVANAATLRGKDAVRTYWEAQFAVASPIVTPTAFATAADESVVVTVDQRVFDLEGRPLVPSTVVFHRYWFAGDLVRRMVVFTDEEAAAEAGSTT
jgi:ketosteroid isomerase-like protein